MTRSSDDSSNTSLSELSRAVCSFAQDRQWERFHDPKNLAMALASEVGELNSLLRWVSNDASDDTVRRQPMSDKVSDEIGDIGILILLLCNRAGIELGDAVERKLARNAESYPLDASIGQAERP
jgi:dCTP diphosphatase